MTQEYIAISIVLLAIGYAIFSLAKTFIPSRNKIKTQGCSDFHCNCAEPLHRKRLRKRHHRYRKMDF